MEHEERLKAPRPGQNLGPYRLMRMIGEGGYGVIFEAEHVPSGRVVALKILTQMRAGSPRALERFRREGRLAASLNHPNCVFIFGAEEFDGLPAISMEVMSGGTLGDLLADGPMDPKEAVDSVLQLLAGLEAAHGLGILHRDVKPSNCFLDESGTTRIGDFGISKTLDVRSDLSATGGFIGTPSYSSPEQIRGEELDLRSDFYSLGATLYELVTGRAPFVGQRPEQVLAKILTKTPRAPSVLNPAIPKALDRVILKLLSKEREKRFSDHAQLRKALRPLSNESLTHGDLAKRFLAAFMDKGALTILGILVTELVTGQFKLIDTWTFTRWSPPLVLFYEVGYFGFFEGVWGRTPFKHLLGLQVKSSKGGALSLKRAFLRALVFSVFFSVLPTVVYTVQFLATSSIYSPIYLLALLPMLVLFSTMRRGNGWAGLHEVLSGSRVMARPRISERPVVSSGLGEANLVQRPEEETGRTEFGPFRATGRVWGSEKEALWIAWDEKLGRRVWVYWNEAGVEELRPLGHKSLRRTKVHWLQGRTERGGRWDAYGLPTGASFLDWVAERGSLDWGELRGFASDICNELQAQEESETRRLTTLRHLWVDGEGQGKVLEFPGTDRGSENAVLSGECDGPLELMKRVLWVGFSGNLEPSEVGGRRQPLAPFPEYLRGILGRLYSETDSYASIGDLADALKGVSTRAARVTRSRRALTFGPTFGMLLIPALGFVVVVATLGEPGWRIDLMMIEEYADSLEALKVSEAVDAHSIQERRTAILTLLSYAFHTAGGSSDSGTPNPWLVNVDSAEMVVLLMAAEEVPSPTEEDAIESRALLSTSAVFQRGILSMGWSRLLFLEIPAVLGMFLGATALVAILLTPPLRGPLLLRPSGIAIQTLDGLRPGRGRCVWRGVIAWVPWLAMFGFVMADLPSEGVPSMVFLNLCVLVGLVGTGYSLHRPDRGIQDVIAGTILVPR